MRKQEFDELAERNRPAELELRLNNARYLGELVKFKLLPPAAFFGCLKACVDAFSAHRAAFAELQRSEGAAQAEAPLADLWLSEFLYRSSLLAFAERAWLAGGAVRDALERFRAAEHRRLAVLHGSLHIQGAARRHRPLRPACLHRARAAHRHRRAGRVAPTPRPSPSPNLSPKPAPEPKPKPKPPRRPSTLRRRRRRRACWSCTRGG